MPMKHTHNSTAQSGFTMVVIAALFIAFAVVAAVAIERNTTVQHITRRDAAEAQLHRLSRAILEYYTFNTNALPCPAATNVAAQASGFGAATTNCHTGVPASGVTELGTNIFVGMVPVQTLSAYGVGINDAFDPWNNRIMYVMNRSLAPNGAPARAALPALADNRTNTVNAVPDFILISYGRDGIGAIKRSSTTVALACATSANIRTENCDTDEANFIIAPTRTDPLATSATYFDDILVYYRLAN
jgi:hypothetical protein